MPRFGELFVIRVAGNVLGPSIMGTLQYAGTHLHTPLFIVLGHEGCGAVEAAIAEKFHGARHRSRIALLLENIVPALDELDPTMPPAALLSAAVEANVRWTIRELLESPEGKARAAQGDVKLVGACTTSSPAVFGSWSRTPRRRNSLPAQRGDDDRARSRVFGDGAHPCRACGSCRFRKQGRTRAGQHRRDCEVLRKDPYDIELLISYGTSKGGSAGHLALAIRDQAPGDDMVYSANFYADRNREHDGLLHRRTDGQDSEERVPVRDGLVARRHGLVRPRLRRNLQAIGHRHARLRRAGRREGGAGGLLPRINDDYRRRARDTEYHNGEIRYDYLRLNCAKTIGLAFKHGAGYKDLEVTSATLLSGRRVVAAANANIPTEMAMKLLKEWNARGYGLDVVLYRKYAGSTYVDPHEEEKVAFKDLPNRFPSVLSRDFRKGQDRTRTPTTSLRCTSSTTWASTACA